ncbi:MAG TPA: sulfotransferase family 2 domain-containing protein [Lacipirellulaceae bacterium]|nr:sulfotransferase family 2 domain-containing protein [Lacipirellulaceae bacterium]
MIITNSFVMLNYPKTGSSFAREVIKAIYDRYPRRFFRRRVCQELILPNIRHEGPPDQHGTYSQIPPQYRRLEVVTIVRDPVRRFISGFEFRHWAHHPPCELGEIKKHFPGFPDLSVEQYVEFNQWIMESGFVAGGCTRGDIGEQTVQFIQLFFRDPQRVLLAMTDEYIDSDSWKGDIGQITFLRQDRLNHELIGFLRRQGFTRKETAFIEQHERVNVTRSPASEQRQELSTAVVDRIKWRERLLFRMLDGLGVSFPKANEVDGLAVDGHQAQCNDRD